MEASLIALRTAGLAALAAIALAPLGMALVRGNILSLLKGPVSGGETYPEIGGAVLMYLTNGLATSRGSMGLARSDPRRALNSL